MKKVVITGATCMLGLSLINECISRKTHVLAVIRGNTERRSLLPKSEYITVYECDLSELHSAEYDDFDFDAFYHFAWDVSHDNGRDNGRNIVDTQQANIGYTLDAVKFAHKLGCRKFVGIGSQAEYGRVSGSITTDTRIAPENAYGISKYAAGKLSSILAEQLCMGFVWTRIFAVYGIHDPPSTMIMYCIDSLLKGKKPALTKCEQQWDYLNTRDAAAALYLLGEKGRNQAIYNIGSGVSRPLSQYVYAIRDAIDPALPLGIGEREYAPKQVMHLCADIADLKADTGFEPSVPFEDGIKEVIQWRRKLFASV